jgi:hypothetical protein
MNKRKIRIARCFPLALLTLTALRPLHGETLRAPSVPLVACDPYFSIWSPSDHLSESDTVHWTGAPHRLASQARIDGRFFRLMGKEPSTLPALEQKSLEVFPTRTLYTFEGQGVKITMTFLTAALPEDLMIYSRPLTYLTWNVQATDGKLHEISINFSASGEIAVNKSSEAVTLRQANLGNLTAIQIGSEEQPVLGKRGDDLRIDWGYFYVAAPLVEHPLLGEGQRKGAGSAVTAEMLFTLDAPVGKTSVSRWLMLAYDDQFSIQYFRKNLKPYWQREGDDAAALLAHAAREYPVLTARCEKFDAEFMKSLSRAGGIQYARLCALAYRQCCAANKVVADDNGQPLMFPKENFSNGCIGTVDVIYPMAPQFLLFSPSLAKAMMAPILDYAASPRWKWPFAPHDLGTYPLANGQVYGGGERTEQNQMPVEETGNMLLLLAALAQVEGNADFCVPYWPVLEKWADYLKAKGFDPENQLCTDDFAGHLAHNVNLSAKAICGLGAFAKLCDLRGQGTQAAELRKLAKEFADRWVKEAADGDHSRLAFDKPGTWSQKYNLVWDRILGLNLFPDSVRRQEMDFYKAHQNKYGLPLDGRKDYTKLDWTLWSATLTQDREDFRAIVEPLYHFAHETSSRVPLTDWYDTKTGKMVGFQARSVVGGLFLQMLYDKDTWKSWASQDSTKASHWAPLPKMPAVITVVPTSETAAQPWRYTTETPSGKWYQPDFDDFSWKEGPGGFGTRETPGSIVRTEWRTADIWLRREITLPEKFAPDLQLRIHHDEDTEVYLNGVLAARLSGFSTQYELVPIKSAAQKTLHPGAQILAVHCHQTQGGQYIDAGLCSFGPASNSP